MYIAQELLPVFSSSIMLVGALVMMFFLNVELAIVFCVTLPATYLVTRYLTRYSKEMDRRTNDQGKAQESFLYEVVSAFRTIRMFNGEGHAKNLWAGHVDKFAWLKMRGAALHDIMLSFPFDTVAGENGVALSGGEKQRIAMARAFMRSTSGILVLDEATSALDALAEEKIRMSVEQARIGRTVIVIAHRLSTIRHADRILVISEGSLVESGTPRELVNRDGIFARMYKAQSLDFE